MSRNITRRRALGGLGGSLLLPLAGEPARAQAAAAGRHFRHGIASGDPDHESLILWTRISGTRAAIQVDWQLALDRDFTQVLSRGSLTADAGHDHAVKVLVGGLPAGGVFYFRFFCGDETSPVGRTRTLPLGEVPEIGLAVVSCSNYPFGYFNAYEAIAGDERVQWVLHLGDYLYEYGPDGYGGETGRLLGREHQPPREILSLADYRERHAQYKADPQSQAMHAAHPLLAVWDDHESANNPWTGGAQNHQPASEGDWTARRDASLRAWYEWMPVREPPPGHSRSNYWRHWRFGSLASLVSLETRHAGRVRQIAYDEHRERLGDRESAQRFLAEVVGAEGRRMLSPAMESFLAGAMSESLQARRPWRLLANQIPMARTLHPPLPAAAVEELAASLPAAAATRLRQLARMGELALPLYLDPWDGYPWARERLYRLCSERGARDLLVLTGDSHSFWLNRLHDDSGGAMGVELGTTGVTSPADFSDLGARGAAFMDAQLAAGNPEVLWTEGRTHGYLRLLLRRRAATADYVGVSTIASRDYDTRLLRRARIRTAPRRLELEPEVPARGA